VRAIGIQWTILASNSNFSIFTNLYNLYQSFSLLQLFCSFSLLQVEEAKNILRESALALTNL
jgi:uncharacterized membrane protein